MNEEKIKKIVGNLDYRKGLSCINNVEYYNKFKHEDLKIYEYYVSSETRRYTKYFVNIITKEGNVLDSSCSCPQYDLTGSCKHLGAALIKHQNEIFKTEKEQSLELSKNIINLFYKDKQNNKGIRKQVSIEVILMPSVYNCSVKIDLKIGIDRKYSLNNKLYSFLCAYNNEEELEFGKSFKYDPSTMYLTEEDIEIIEFLDNMNDNNYYFDSKNLSLQGKNLNHFMSLLKNKKYTIMGYGIFNGFIKGNPYQIKLEKNTNYELTVDTTNIEPLGDSNYVIANKTIYLVSNNIKKIINTMKTNGLETLEFLEEDIDKFSKSILPIVKEEIKVSKDLQDKFLIGLKPNIKLYIDYYYNFIICNVKLTYKDKEINYFEEIPGLIRDIDEEEKVVNKLLEYNFKIEDNKFIIKEIDVIGEFLEQDLIKLAKEYEVFTSEKIKQTKLVKTSVKSSFSIGQDNILSYNFKIDNIEDKELLDIINTLRNKKKYYRLKSGDIINLNENEEIRQLNDLIEDIELTDKDIVSGYGIIPKYRAIYLDSLKNDKYSIIDTNNTFNELVSKFNKYKDIELEISTKDKKILRDYQITGVKWLYNIYKCGFGSILADEMGLGKSIQLIYLIKQILKEKPDSKILIVAPTSLIYNWKAEFDKFARELKYKVFSENKKKREEDLNNIDDINIYITTYGLIRQDKEIYKSFNFELIAIDEAQNIKNINAQMTRIIKKINATCKIALTGTPLENNVTELWSIFDFIMPGYLTSIKKFNQKYNIKDVDEDNINKLNTLNKQIQPFILRRKKKDVVLELPDKIENNVYIDLNKDQMKLYMAEVEKTKQEIEELVNKEGFKTARFKILQLLTKLRQICIDPSIVFENYNKQSSKIEEVVKLVKEVVNNNHKILLFTSFKTALDIVNKKLCNAGITTYVIDGSVPSKKRMELVNKFNNDDTNVFLITLKAGGTGLNLTSADIVIHLDLWWNPQVENQATDRAHRIGQKNTVEVIKLVCKGTIEERILELQQKKKILTDALIEGEDRDKNIISTLTEKDIKNLLVLDNNE